MLLHSVLALGLIGFVASQGPTLTTIPAGSPSIGVSNVVPTTLTVTTTVTAFAALTSATSQAAVLTAVAVVPSSAASSQVAIPSAPLPPVQAWCANGRNTSYCAGPLLQALQLSGIYSDSKTFPDKPTLGDANETFQAFASLPSNATYGQVLDFAESNFRGEGLEIVPVPIQGFKATPAVLDSIDDQFYRGFVSIVNGYWSLLIRETNQSALCTDAECDSSLIPLNRTIVVPGGRYREVYYWDSFWILEGLLRSELYDYAEDLLVNFMDLIEQYGFIFNGGRKYYANRSQPPVFVLMVNAFIQTTRNDSILARALPLLETELAWWSANRTINVQSPYTGKNHSVARFDVSINTAPRPEGYVEDYETAFGAQPPLNETQRSNLYAELATGAESGWDYSSRWCKEPLLNVTDNLPALRTLNARAIIPVDLNAILYGAHALLAEMYQRYSNKSALNSTETSGMSSKISKHQSIANETRSAILDLMWDPAKSYFYDFNTTDNARSDLFHAGALFPFWFNITQQLNNESEALKVFEGIRFIAGKYPGSPSVATLLQTGLNWDFPNVWPPHTYTSIKALETIGRLYPNATVLDSAISYDFDAIPLGQLGMNENDLPQQPLEAVGPNSAIFSARVAEMQAGKPWWQALAIEFANRYMNGVFCSWLSTGGSIPGLLPAIESSAGSVTSDTGHIFEKFNATDVDAAGGGGEYDVVIGFGWTNGVVLHTAGEYGQYLVPPTCPLITIVQANSTQSKDITSTLKKQFRGYRVPPSSGLR